MPRECSELWSPSSDANQMKREAWLKDLIFMKFKKKKKKILFWFFFFTAWPTLPLFFLERFLCPKCKLVEFTRRNDCSKWAVRFLSLDLPLPYESNLPLIPHVYMPRNPAIGLLPLGFRSGRQKDGCSCRLQFRDHYWIASRFLWLFTVKVNLFLV